MGLSTTIKRWKDRASGIRSAPKPTVRVISYPFSADASSNPACLPDFRADKKEDTIEGTGRAFYETSISIMPAESELTNELDTSCLWNQAYDMLRNESPELVDRYETLLSKELDNEITSNIMNQVNSDPTERQNQLRSITERGIQRIDVRKTKYRLFGHEFVVREQFGQVGQLINTVKCLIDTAVRASPEASLAWAGVSILLPILSNPSIAEEATREGLTYVTSRIGYYTELECLLWPENLCNQDLKVEFHKHIMDLYQHILEFQMKTTLRFYRKWIANLGRDMLLHDDWTGMLSNIKALEQLIRYESDSLNTIASRKIMEDISTFADRQCEDLQSLVSIATDHLQVSVQHRDIAAEQMRLQRKMVDERPLDLPIIPQACYDSADVQDSPKCEEGTRVRIQQTIFNWIDQESAHSMFWLNGPAGTGKSTIARTVADCFARTGGIVAGYFFKRGDKDRNDTFRIFSTLAAQLAAASHAFRECLQKSVYSVEKDGIDKKSLEMQFEVLLMKPLVALNPEYRHGQTALIVVDALDECERPDQFGRLIELLLSLNSLGSMRIKVLLTSRSAREVFSVMEQHVDHGSACSMQLHRVFCEDTAADIRTFLSLKFSEIKKQCRIQEDPWPAAVEFNRLVQLATAPEPLFIYAATLSRFVFDPQRPRNPKAQLRTWLKQSGSGGSQLQQIYDPILRRFSAEYDRTTDSAPFQVLGALLLLEVPLSLNRMAGLLVMDVDDVRWWLQELHAVVDVPPDADTPVRPFHKSFSDYMLNCGGSETCTTTINIPDTHAMLAAKCFDRMKKGLKDFCDSLEPGTDLCNVNFEPYDREGLGYACLYWGHHVRASGQLMQQSVTEFLGEHILYWIETQIAMTGEYYSCGSEINKLLLLYKEFPDTSREIAELLEAAVDLLSGTWSPTYMRYRGPRGPPLFFLSKESILRQKFLSTNLQRFDVTMVGTADCLGDPTPDHICVGKECTHLESTREDENFGYKFVRTGSICNILKDDEVLIQLPAWIVGKVFCTESSIIISCKRQLWMIRGG